MAAVDKRQGSDIDISITLTDAAGDLMNIDNLAELFVYVTNTASKTILKKFSKAGAGEFIALDKITTTNYKAIVKSATTKVAVIGYYDLDVNVVQTDADYDDSEKNTVGVEMIFNLLPSVSKTSSS